MMKKLDFCFLLLLLFVAGHQTHAQNQNILGTNLIQQSVQETATDDTISTINVTDKDLDDIIDLRTQFEKQNSGYSLPATPSEQLLRFLKKDELEMSEEALYWARMVRDASTLFDEYMTFRDTIIVNPLFMPIVFKGDYLPHSLTFYNFDMLKEKTPYDNLYPTDTLFKEEQRMQALTDMAYKHVQNNYPTYFRYTTNDLPTEAVKANIIKKNIHEDIPLKVVSEVSFDDVDAPSKFIPERKYWISHFESSIQFAQNYVSPNWHKGGNSSLNLNNREYLRYDFNKDRIKFTNELEIKNNLYTAPNDTLRSYKVSDDVFRLHSNFGYLAFSKWYYSFDFEFRTQLLSSFAENSDLKESGLLSPYTINIGLGMKYDLNKTFQKKHKSLMFNANIAPLSLTFRHTIDDEINLGRHFKKKESEEKYPTKECVLGSTINATLNFQINKNVSWYSRFYYTTGYHRIEGEWENRFTFAWSRFFSTNITLNMRYDDGVTKNEDFNSFLQLNELLSFGFNYKW